MANNIRYKIPIPKVAFEKLKTLSDKDYKEFQEWATSYATWACEERDKYWFWILKANVRVLTDLMKPKTKKVK